LALNSRCDCINHFLEERAYFTFHGMFTTKSLNPHGSFSPLKLARTETHCEVDTTMFDVTRRIFGTF
jgi:hypothetical protein